MSFHVFGFVLFKSKQTFGKWNLSLSEMWKMLSKNPKRGWSHTAYWIPTLLLSLYSFKCPPWQTSDIHSNYLVNRDLRPNCCAEGGLNVRVHIMSKHFYLESRYFAKVKIVFRMIFEIKRVKVFMSSLISNQFVYGGWDSITLPCFHKASFLLILDYNQCPVVQSFFWGIPTVVWPRWIYSILLIIYIFLKNLLAFQLRNFQASRAWLMIKKEKSLIFEALRDIKAI